MEEIQRELRKVPYLCELYEKQEHTRLSVLNMSYLGLKELPPPKVFTVFSKIEVINLSDNYIKRFDPQVFISGCPNIAEINLARNDISSLTDLYALGELRNLKSLNIKGNPIEKTHKYSILLQKLILPEHARPKTAMKFINASTNFVPMPREQEENSINNKLNRFLPTSSHSTLKSNLSESRNFQFFIHKKCLPRNFGFFRRLEMFNEKEITYQDIMLIKKFNKISEIVDEQALRSEGQNQYNMKRNKSEACKNVNNECWRSGGSTNSMTVRGMAKENNSKSTACLDANKYVKLRPASQHLKNYIRRHSKEMEKYSEVLYLPKNSDEDPLTYLYKIDKINHERRLTKNMLFDHVSAIWNNPYKQMNHIFRTRVLPNLTETGDASDLNGNFKKPQETKGPRKDPKVRFIETNLSASQQLIDSPKGSLNHCKSIISNLKNKSSLKKTVPEQTGETPLKSKPSLKNFRSQIFQLVELRRSQSPSNIAQSPRLNTNESYTDIPIKVNNQPASLNKNKPLSMAAANLMKKMNSFVEGEPDPEFLKKKYLNFEDRACQLHPKKLLNNSANIMGKSNMNTAPRRGSSTLMAKENDRNQNFQPSAFKTLNSQVINPTDNSEKVINSNQNNMTGNSLLKANKALLKFDGPTIHGFMKEQSEITNGAEFNPNYNSHKPPNNNLSKNQASPAMNTSSRKTRRRNIESDLNTILGDLKSLSIQHNLNELTSAIENLQNLEKKLGKSTRKENLPSKENFIDKPPPKKRSSKLAAMLKNMYGDSEQIREQQESLEKEKYMIHEIFKSKTDLKNKLRSSKSSIRFRKALKNILPVESKSLKRVESELKTLSNTYNARQDLIENFYNDQNQDQIQQQNQPENSEKKSTIEFSKNQLMTLTKFYVLQRLLAKRKKDNLTDEENNILAQLKDLVLDDKKLQELKDNLLKQGIADLEKGYLIRNCEVQN